MTSASLRKADGAKGGPSTHWVAKPRAVLVPGATAFVAADPQSTLTKKLILGIVPVPLPRPRRRRRGDAGDGRRRPRRARGQLRPRARPAARSSRARSAPRVPRRRRCARGVRLRVAAEETKDARLPRAAAARPDLRPAHCDSYCSQVASARAIAASSHKAACKRARSQRLVWHAK